MAQVNYLGLIPYCANSNAEDGLPVQVWDGSTLYNGVPSKSDTSQISVVGQGTPYPLGLTANELAHLYWKVKKIGVNFTETITSSCTLYGNGEFVENPNDRAGTINLSPSLVANSTPQIETDLICGSGGFSSSQYANFNFSLDFSRIFVIDEIYYPLITIRSASHQSTYANVNSTISYLNERYSQYMVPGGISYTSSGGTSSLDLFGTGSKIIQMYLSGAYFGANEFSEFGGIFNPGLQVQIYYNNYGNFVTAYYGSVSSQCSIIFTESQTWPYNP